MRTPYGAAIGWTTFLLACHHAAPATAPDNAGGTTDPPQVILTIEQGPCMGACPRYSATLSDDGTLVVDGIENVVSTGEQRTQLDHATVEAIDRAFTDARFTDLDDDGNLPKPMDCHTDPNGVTTCSGSSYGCSDTSHTTISYRGRTLDDPHCVETDLSRLEDRILPLLQLHVWISGRD